MNITGNIKMSKDLRSEYNLRQDIKQAIAEALEEFTAARDTVCSTDRKLSLHEERKIKQNLVEKIASAIAKA